ncbi:hypothetical protein B9J80_01520 [Vibrio sp. V12_P9A6T4]|uniref:DUF2986 domain-containing protein n=1 Tax=Vibrio sp. V12_P9A6T4 TaxID=1938667 RepID=UPI000B8E6F07|nr:DUF2986 domain-containing protein [Vibrio sp. V12_P9A6T4]OXX57371.1 hypothetical protein B9J80_01520 [Vibrio sp. V12_P9A6T4]
MNRKKKINQTLQKHLKKKHAKLHGSNKPRYISKAEREKLDAEQAASTSTVDNQHSEIVPAEGELQQ